MSGQGKEARASQIEIVGLIPAAGQGTRIGPLPCSKEVYPIGYDQDRGGRPKAVSQYLLEKMRSAGIKKAYIILREGKWDIPAYLLDGKRLGMHLAYLIMDAPFGVPFTVDQAYPFVQESIVAFGFPDIFFEPDDVFVKLLIKLADRRCDVVLGLFPSDRPDKADMVDIDLQGKIRNIVIKPQETNLRFTWGVAVWTPIFTQFLHSQVEAWEPSAAPGKELFVGDVVRAAMAEGLQVEAVTVSDQPYLDIGTPDDLFRAAKRLMDQTEKIHLGGK
jgi:glucose-1-phosphate thymidylyltransferase